LPSRPYQFCGPLRLLSTRDSFFVAKAAGSWSWQLTLVKCQGLQCMQRYLHFLYSPRNVHGFTLMPRAPCQTRMYRARLWHFWLVHWRCSVRMSVEAQTVVTDIFRSFHQSLQANAGMVPEVTPRKLPFTFLSNSLHCSLIILPFDV
jgi:hypothetical protein